MPIPIFSALSIVPSVLGWLRAKQEAKLKLYQIAWEACKEITSFFVQNWRVILRCLMVLAILAYIIALRAHVARLQQELSEETAQKEQISRNFVDYVAKIAQFAQKQQQEMQNKQVLADAKLAELKSSHEKTLNKILKGHANETQNLDFKLNSLRDRVRFYAERAGGSGMPEDGQNRDARHGDAAVARQSDIETLELAGAVCAADYNRLRDYILIQQQKIGVKNE